MTIHLGRRASAEFDWVPMGDGDAVAFGDVRLVILGKPRPHAITLGFLTGRVPGLFAGSFLGRRLPGPLLAPVFAVVIPGVAAFVIARTLRGG